MTHNEFIQLLNQPDTIDAGHIPDLKEMISHYPYFSQARILLAKAMLKTSNLHAESYVQQAALHVPDRRSFYYFLYPEKKINTEQIQKERIPRFSGNYFDMLKATENDGEDSGQSLKNLAQRLKSAREMILEKSKISPQKAENTVATQVRIPTPEYFSLENNTKQSGKAVSEEYVKILIKEKKYREAIEILNKLNLINPKKSIYFADQIRFLEKILVNTKK
jgi:hypothetical protein